MAPLTFVDTYNMGVFLSKSDASAGFDQIVDFLNGHVIQYALMVNPTIYVSCIKQLWATVSIKKANDDLHLDDVDGVECLPNKEIFTELALQRGLRGTNLVVQWHLLLSALQQYISSALTQKVFANMRRVSKGFSGVETLLFATVLVQPQPPATEEEDEEEEEVNATKPTVFDDEEVTMTMAQTLIKMKAKKARLLDEQMPKRLHDEEPAKDEEPTKKRVAEETLLHESFKKLKAVEVSGSHSTQDTLTVNPKEMSKEDVKNMLEIVPVSEFKVEALQVKEDLDALWRLVKKKFSITVPTVDKKKALWVELKRLFKPDTDDVIWKLQRFFIFSRLKQGLNIVVLPFKDRKGKPKFRKRNQGKARRKNKNWMEEISHVLWEHRTMIKSSNGDTSFLLTYGTEAVIPAEIGMPTIRTAKVDMPGDLIYCSDDASHSEEGGKLSHKWEAPYEVTEALGKGTYKLRDRDGKTAKVDMVQNDEALEINLDLLEERRERTTIREGKSKAKIGKYYNSKVRGISFKPGDLIYCSNDASHSEEGGKLSHKWEAPYEVTEALGKGTYKLRDRDGKESILERAKHKRDKDRRMNDRMMQSKERKDNSSTALDAGLVVTESNETESESYVLSNRSGNDTHTDDADISFVNDKQPMAKVQLSAEHNILANEQHYSEQSESVYDTYLLEKVDRNTTPESTDLSHRGREIEQNADD
uniref:Reverse transcriptase domain-containing protein n=1 Tax=Tanacetum cinerariifolium TaxID=118510 RepID=A0A6L2LIB7_TANCI|nr:hypothetical protein [Tanacetum cinerariifolium]